MNHHISLQDRDIFNTAHVCITLNVIRVVRLINVRVFDGSFPQIDPDVDEDQRKNPERKKLKLKEVHLTKLLSTKARGTMAHFTSARTNTSFI